MALLRQTKTLKDTTEQELPSATSSHLLNNLKQARSSGAKTCKTGLSKTC